MSQPRWRSLHADAPGARASSSGTLTMPWTCSTGTSAAMTRSTGRAFRGSRPASRTRHDPSARRTTAAWTRSLPSSTLVDVHLHQQDVVHVRPPVAPRAERGPLLEHVTVPARPGAGERNKDPRATKRAITPLRYHERGLVKPFIASTSTIRLPASTRTSAGIPRSVRGARTTESRRTSGGGDGVSTRYDG